jgi:hypothetical protein
MTELVNKREQQKALAAIEKENGRAFMAVSITWVRSGETMQAERITFISLVVARILTQNKFDGFPSTNRLLRQVGKGFGGTDSAASLAESDSRFLPIDLPCYFLTKR